MMALVAWSMGSFAVLAACIKRSMETLDRRRSRKRRNKTADPSWRSFE